MAIHPQETATRCARRVARIAGVAQAAEQLPCKQQVVGSTPSASSGVLRFSVVFSGGVPERPKGADCKSAANRLRRFESSPLHPTVPSLRRVAATMKSPAGVAQLVELQPSKLDVAGSSPVARSKMSRVRDERHRLAQIAQLVEHVLGKDEVTGSIPVLGSKGRAGFLE